MTPLRDIEAAEELKGEHTFVPAPPSTSDTRSTSSKTHTSKSAGKSIVLPVNPEILRDPEVLRSVKRIVNFNSGVEIDESNDEDDVPKRDPVFGSCCDLVKVCMIVDCFYIFQKIAVFITILLGLSVLSTEVLEETYLEDSSYDDALAEPEAQAMVDQNELKNILLLIKEALGVPFAIIGLWGAYRFHTYLVLTMAIWCCVDLIWSLSFQRWLSSLYVAFYIYPHMALFWSLKKEVITRDNYDDVKHCCCKETRYKCCNEDDKTKSSEDPKPEQPRS